MKNIILITALLIFQVTFGQFPEGFETSVPPAGWVTFIGANGLGTVQNWQASNISNTGTQSAYVRYENVSGGLAQDWLVTPQFTPTSSTNILSFMQRQSYTTDYGSVYKVFISTGSQTTHADFVLVDTQTEADFTYYYTERQIDLSSYVGVPIYVAFVMEQDDGDNWLIDDVDLTSLPTCDAPSALTLSNLTQTSAMVSWTAPGTQTGYNLRLYEGTDATTTPVIEQLGLSGSLVDSGSYLSGLNAETSYYFTIQSICGTDLSIEGGIGFTTSAAPIVPSPDYTEEFSTFPGPYWSEASGAFADGPTGTTSDWQSDLFANQGTNTCAKVNIYFSNQNHWLISPDFDLSGGAFTLSLEAAVTEWNLTTPSAMGSDDSVRLLASQDSGITWSVLYTWDASNTPSNTGTTLASVDLSPYTGIVRFALLASDGTVNDVEDYDFFIDNFRIQSGALGTTDITDIELKGYPNPVTDSHFYITNKEIITEINIYNVLGQRTEQLYFNSNNISLDLQQYQTGYYFVDVISNNKSKVIKIFKQ